MEGSWEGLLAPSTSKLFLSYGLTGSNSSFGPAMPFKYFSIELASTKPLNYGLSEFTVIDKQAIQGITIDYWFVGTPQTVDFVVLTLIKPLSLSQSHKRMFFAPSVDWCILKLSGCLTFQRRHRCLDRANRRQSGVRFRCSWGRRWRCRWRNLRKKVFLECCGWWFWTGVPSTAFLRSEDDHSGEFLQDHQE